MGSNTERVGNLLLAAVVYVLSFAGPNIFGFLPPFFIYLFFGRQAAPARFAPLMKGVGGSSAFSPFLPFLSWASRGE